MKREELDSKGVNDSAVHVDFMFGTKDMEIIGVKGTEEIQIFKEGDFII